jgi:hypothetical protein
MWWKQGHVYQPFSWEWFIPTISDDWGWCSHGIVLTTLNSPTGGFLNQQCHNVSGAPPTVMVRLNGESFRLANDGEIPEIIGFTTSTIRRTKALRYSKILMYGSHTFCLYNLWHWDV